LRITKSAQDQADETEKETSKERSSGRGARERALGYEVKSRPFGICVEDWRRTLGRSPETRARKTGPTHRRTATQVHGSLYALSGALIFPIYRSLSLRLCSALQVILWQRARVWTLTS
jgi:hypothetical protein